MIRINSYFDYLFTPVNWLKQEPQRERVPGVFYKIKDSQRNTQGYLLGTLHCYLGDLILFHRKILRALEKAKKVLPEIYLMPPDKKINFIDLQIIELALKLHKSIEALESFSGQMEALNKNSESSEQFSLFYKIILEKSHLPEAELTEEERAVISEVKCLRSTWEKGTEEFFKTPDAEAFFKTIREKHPALFDARDALFVEKIEQSLLKKEKPFIAVGMLHLFGEKGVVSLLRKKGWIVEKLDYVDPPKNPILKKIAKFAKRITGGVAG